MALAYSYVHWSGISSMSNPILIAGKKKSQRNSRLLSGFTDRPMERQRQRGRRRGRQMLIYWEYWPNVMTILTALWGKKNFKRIQVVEWKWMNNIRSYLSITTNLQAVQQPLNECLHANKNKVMSESKEILTHGKKKKVSNGSVIYD